jgi:chemotaxis regulatin CheY-phosphate phosphatase CheZ
LLCVLFCHDTISNVCYLSISSIDDDILKLMDEVKLDKFLKEASEAIDDADKLAEFIREKAATAIERFLVSLSAEC